MAMAAAAAMYAVGENQGFGNIGDHNMGVLNVGSQNSGVTNIGTTGASGLGLLAYALFLALSVV
jgi:hypothetical protein